MIRYRGFLVLYLDSTEKSDELDEYFAKEGHDTVKCEHVEDVINVLKSKTDAYTKTVLIWHLTSSCFDDRYIEEDDALKKAVQYLKDNISIVLDFNLAVSDNHNFYNTAREIPWFDFADSWYQLRTLFKLNDGYSLVKGLKSLSYVKKKDEVTNTTSFLRHLFLPLDIDMQALKTTGNPVAYFNDMHADLEELYKSEEYKDAGIDEHYRRKLYSLWRLFGASLESNQIPFKAKELAPINNPSNDLLKLTGLENGNREESPIYKFLESLDERKTEAINYFLAPFESRGLKGCDGKEINSFHDWYCALDLCLRGEETCK